MKKLSERLGRVIDILEADGDEHNVTEVIFEGFKLALAVEAAPVMSVSMVAEGHMTGLYLHPTTDESPAHGLIGKRVRIVPEKEG